MRPPTADEIALAQTFTGNPIDLNDRATRGNRPPRLDKKPRGRPRKDGQPPHQSPEAAEKERHAAAAKVYAATSPSQARAALAANVSRLPKFANADTITRIKNLDLGDESKRAQTFLEVFASAGYRDAERVSNSGPVIIQQWKKNREFSEIYAAIRDAHDAACVAKTCGTLAALANGEYKPAPDCLPPDMRAASLLMPALDPRFRPSGQTAAQQVQINIQI